MLLLNVGCFLFCLHFNGSFLTTLSVSHTACSVAGPGHWDSERYLERVSGREWRAQYISDEFSSLPKQDCLHSEPSLPRSLIPHTFPKRFLASTTWLGFTGTEINEAELQYLKKKKERNSVGRRSKQPCEQWVSRGSNAYSRQVRASFVT